MISEKLSIPFSIMIAGCIIAGSLYLSNANTTKQSAKNNQIAQTQGSGMRAIGSDDHILGNPEAEIILVEYSDTECPYCKTFHQTLQRMMNEYGKDGKVAWVYRSFPIDQLHSKSRNEAEATECANGLGGPSKFWEYLNMVYDRTTSNNTLNASELPKIATAIGLDVKSFNECLSSGKYEAKVEADYQDAINAGATGTPYSIIITKDGTKTPLSGAYSYEQLKNILDSILK